VFLTGVVAISQTPSMSSGLTSPSVGISSRSESSRSMEFDRSSVSSSTIMSSSSIPRVYEGPVNRCSISRGGYNPCMTLGYNGKLYILAFDHRGSFQKKMFGIEGDPTPEQTDTIADAKHLIFEGLLKAIEQGVDPHATGCLVDEQFGEPKGVPSQAKETGLLLAMPVEKSGQNEFDFEYGDDFGAHIEKFDPDFSKVLVRYNPEGDAEMNARQSERLKRLADWLHENDRKFLFELLVPAEDHQLEQVDGDTDRYDAELRPELMRRAITELQDAGIEADIWKIEGIDTQEDCEAISKVCRRDGRNGVICVVLGRGANDDKVDHWLRQGAPVEGYAGFAIGRTIWWDALKGFLENDLERDEAANQIAEKYLRFVQVYREAAREHATA
jgi:myo-inositol catabolism protein IolC